MKIQAVLMLGALLFASAASAAPAAATEIPMLHVTACSVGSATAGRSIEIGDVLAVGYQGLFRFDRGSLVIRPDGAVVAVDATGKNQLILGQATPYQISAAAVDPSDLALSTLCTDFFVHLSSDLTLQLDNQQGAPKPCSFQDANDANPSCMEVRRTLTLTKNNAPVLQKSCVDYLMINSSRDQDHDRDPNACGGYYTDPSVITAAEHAQFEKRAQERIVVTAQTTPAEKLIAAAKLDDVKMASEALAAGADVNSTSTQGNSAAAVAAAYGSESVLALLIQAHADVNLENQQGDAPMVWAAIRGQTATAHLLAGAGAKLDSRGTHKWDIVWTPLTLAMNYFQRPMVDRLLTDGASVDLTSSRFEIDTPLCLAAAWSDVALTQIILGHNPKIEASCRSGSGSGHYTPLLWAVSRGNAALTQLLLSAGAKTEPFGLNANTALSVSLDAYGTFAERRPAIEVLLKGGLDLNQPLWMTGCSTPSSSSRDYPLAVVAERGDLSMVQLFLAHGAQVNTKSGCQQHTALYFAQERQHADVVAALKAAGGLAQ